MRVHPLKRIGECHSGALRLVRWVVAWLALGYTCATFAVVAPPPQIEATAHILVDFHSQRVLSQDAATSRVEPASLTKLMTEYVVFSELATGRITLDDKVKISKRAWSMKGSRMFVEPGSEVRVEDLLQGVIIQSGNDASVALAEHVAGSVQDFSVLMNKHASALGMRDSNFVNAHGLPHPEHYTTARDMARLATALIAEFPDYYRWHSKRAFQHNNITQPNRNRLLWSDESVDGMKTGYTNAAGYCLVASARRRGMRLISVVMGTKSPAERARQSKRLLDYGFKNFETHRLYGAREIISEVRVWEGDKERLALGLQDDLVVTIPRGQYASLQARLELRERVMAPVAVDSQQGTLRVVLGDELVAERPLLSLTPIELGNLWRRLSDRVQSMLE